MVQVRQVHGQKEIWPLCNACWEMISISCGYIVRDVESKAKLGVTFNSDKQDVIDFKKFLKLKMCRASDSEANS